MATLLDAMAGQNHVERQRIEAFVACWSRVVDEENIGECIDTLSPEGRVDLSERIGFLNLGTYGFGPLSQ